MHAKPRHIARGVAGAERLKTGFPRGAEGVDHGPTGFPDGYRVRC